MTLQISNPHINLRGTNSSIASEIYKNCSNFSQSKFDDCEFRRSNQSPPLFASFPSKLVMTLGNSTKVQLHAVNIVDPPESQIFRSISQRKTEGAKSFATDKEQGNFASISQKLSILAGSRNPAAQLASNFKLQQRVCREF